MSKTASHTYYISMLYKSYTLHYLHIAYHTVHVTHKPLYNLKCVCVEGLGAPGTNLTEHNENIHTPYRSDWEIGKDTCNYSVFTLIELHYDVLPLPSFTRTHTNADESSDQIYLQLYSVICSSRWCVYKRQEITWVLSLCGFPRWLGGSDNRKDGQWELWSSWVCRPL